MSIKTAVAYCMHDDVDYLRSSLESMTSVDISDHVKSLPTNVFAFISRLPWHSAVGDWQAAAATAEALGATVVFGDWPSELAQRQAAIDHLLTLDFTHALIPDGDEILEPALLQTLLTLAQHRLADRVYVHWDTYWKTPEYVIRPRERFTPATSSTSEPQSPPAVATSRGEDYCCSDPSTGWSPKDAIVPGSRPLRALAHSTRRARCDLPDVTSWVCFRIMPTCRLSLSLAPATLLPPIKMGGRR